MGSNDRPPSCRGLASQLPARTRVYGATRAPVLAVLGWFEDWRRLPPSPKGSVHVSVVLWSLELAGAPAFQLDGVGL